MWWESRCNIRYYYVDDINGIWSKICGGICNDVWYCKLHRDGAIFGGGDSVGDRVWESALCAVVLKVGVLDPSLTRSAFPENSQPEASDILEHFNCFGDIWDVTTPSHTLIDASYTMLNTVMFLRCFLSCISARSSR